MLCDVRPTAILSAVTSLIRDIPARIPFFPPPAPSSRPPFSALFPPKFFSIHSTLAPTMSRFHLLLLLLLLKPGTVPPNSFTSHPPTASTARPKIRFHPLAHAEEKSYRIVGTGDRGQGTADSIPCRNGGCKRNQSVGRIRSIDRPTAS